MQTLKDSLAGPEKGAEYFAGYLLEQSLSGGPEDLLELLVLYVLFQVILSMPAPAHIAAGAMLHQIHGKILRDAAMHERGLCAHSRQLVRLHPGVQLPEGPPGRPEQGEFVTAGLFH